MANFEEKEVHFTFNHPFLTIAGPPAYLSKGGVLPRGRSASVSMHYKTFYHCFDKDDL